MGSVAGGAVRADCGCRAPAGGYDLANGDGLLLHGKTLYVVQNQLDKVPVFRLSHDVAQATFAHAMARPGARRRACRPQRSASKALRTMALRTGATQELELEQLRTWLAARGETAPPQHGAHGAAPGTGMAQMPGMLSGGELERLERSQGKAFDRLFLRFMIRHHRGAIQMVEGLYAADGGQEPEVDALARGIDSDQLIEIGRMEQMLAELS